VGCEKRRGEKVRMTRKRKEKENRRRNTLDIPKAEFEKRKNEKGAIYSSFDPFPRIPPPKKGTHQTYHYDENSYEYTMESSFLQVMVQLRVSFPCSVMTPAILFYFFKLLCQFLLGILCNRMLILVRLEERRRRRESGKSTFSIIENNNIANSTYELGDGGA
jgi:hypothetical protein